MMHKFILFALIFELMSSKEISSYINYAVTNQQLILNYKYDGNLDDPIIVYAQPDYDDLLLLFGLIGSSISYSIFVYWNKRGEGTVKMDFQKDIEIKLIYLQRSNCTGKYWINPYKNELEIDLSQKYGKMIPLVGFLIDFENIFTYFVINLQKDYHAIFQYQTNFIYDNETYYNISNPFVVWDEKECLGNITSFNFTKGKSYKILLKTQILLIKLDESKFINLSVLPGYAFYSDGNNDLINSIYLRFKFLLILLNLFLL